MRKKTETQEDLNARKEKKGEKGRDCVNDSKLRGVKKGRSILRTGKGS